MKRKFSDHAFVEQVFPAEFEEIRRRRRDAGDDRLLADSRSSVEPSTEHELVGLAVSVAAFARLLSVSESCSI